MTDEIDIANEIAEAQLTDAIQAARRVVRLEPKSECYNCEAPVGGEALFCGTDCEQEHRWYVERSKQNGDNT